MELLKSEPMLSLIGFLIDGIRSPTPKLHNFFELEKALHVLLKPSLVVLVLNLLREVIEYVFIINLYYIDV